MAKSKPKTARIDDVPIVERLRSLSLPGGVSTTLEFPLVDDRGLAVDLTEYVPSGTPAFPPVLAKFREAARGDDGIVTVPGTILDAEAGTVNVVARADTANLRPGIYTLDVAACDPTTGAPALINSLLVHVEPTAFAPTDRPGPPAVKEVRLRLRDSSPAENRLLDETLVDDAEVAQALLWVVQKWNALMPPTPPLNTTNFPHRQMWVEGASAILLRVAAAWYRKNRLSSSAGGVSVDDMDKADAMEQAAAVGWQAFEDWAKNQKYAQNLEAGYGSIGSPYGAMGYGYGGGYF